MTESVRKSLPLQDGVNSLFCHELVIGGFIHKAVQFGRISQAQAKKPAVLLRIAVDERRLIFQRAVHFNDFAGNRRIDIRSGFHGFDDSRRSEEHTYELQSLMRISYAVFCLTKNKHPRNKKT